MHKYYQVNLSFVYADIYITNYYKTSPYSVKVRVKEKEEEGRIFDKCLEMSFNVKKHLDVSKRFQKVKASYKNR